MTISFDPYTTTNTTGTFGTSSQGYIQGVAQDDPVTRYKMAGGVVASTETYPMWGGEAITAVLPSSTSTAAGMLGATLSLAATTEANIQGFTVFDGGLNGIITASSQVPLYVQGSSINYYRLGSGARIPLKIDSTSASALLGASPATALYWDFDNQELTTTAGTVALDIIVLDVQLANSMTVTYDTDTGYATWATSGYTAVVEI